MTTEPFVGGGLEGPGRPFLYTPGEESQITENPYAKRTETCKTTVILVFFARLYKETASLYFLLRASYKSLL